MAGILDPLEGFSASDKLQGSCNYLVWAFKARNIFRRYKCWITVGAKVQSPAGGGSSGSNTQKSSGSSSNTLSTMSNFEINPAETEDDRKLNAVMIFCFIVADHLILTVESFENDPAELWLDLKRQFQAGALMRQLALESRLNYTRMKDGQTIEEQINTMVSELGETNCKIDQNRLVNKVLDGLPRNRWENFVENFGLHMRRNPYLQLSELIELSYKATVAYHEETAMPLSSNNSSTTPRNRDNAERYYRNTTMRPTNDISKISPPNSTICGYCSNAGHAEKDCRIKIREQRIINNVMLQISKNKSSHAHSAEADNIDDHSDADFEHLETGMASLDLSNDPTWYVSSGHQHCVCSCQCSCHR